MPAYLFAFGNCGYSMHATTATATATTSATTTNAHAASIEKSKGR
jgi:hypothetical protein